MAGGEVALSLGDSSLIHVIGLGEVVDEHYHDYHDGVDDQSRVVLHG